MLAVGPPERRGIPTVKTLPRGSDVSRPLSRRALLQGAALSACGACLSCGGRPLPPATGGYTKRQLSLGDPPSFRTDASTANIQTRFGLYQAANVGTLRIGIGWNGMETSSGHWSTPSWLRTYAGLAQQHGFGIKLLLQNMGAIPQWFSAANPSGQLLDQGGATTQLSMSYWYPSLHAVLGDAADNMFRLLSQDGVLEAVRYLFVDLGSSGESKYPSPHEVGRPGPLFWCYDSHAQQSFAAAMEARYGGGLTQANAAWGTGFTSWSEVQVPQPGKQPGQMWSDVLDWYQASRRDFVSWQVATYQALANQYAPGVPLVVGVPGSHITAAQWQSAISAGEGGVTLGLMIDTEWLLNTAHRMGVTAQYTGAENQTELQWIVQTLKADGISGLPLWGENAGVYPPTEADNPRVLVNDAVADGLYGVEYINASNLFEPDGLTPNGWYTMLQSAYAELLQR